MASSKLARPDHPVHDLIAQRWSPYAFSDRTVADSDLRSLFEAARWAPSSYNEQPWRYILASKSDPAAFKRLLTCLVEANQEWASGASALAIGRTSLKFSRNGKPNGVALHDLGLASAHLTFEATARGLVVHQMGGILPDRVRLQYRVPEGFQPLTALAIGYAAEPDSLPEKYRERDTSIRERRPLSAFVFGENWDSPSSIVAK